MKIYISLPITGRDMGDVAAETAKAEDAVRRAGHTPVSPLALEHRDPEDYPAVMGTDITALLVCDAVMFMPGWRDSRGCRLEHAAAYIYGKITMYGEVRRQSRRTERQEHGSKG